MFQQLRENPLAATALAVAITGTSIAIAGLPHNSVGTKQIRKAGVHKSDIHAHAVTSSKLAIGVLKPTEGFAKTVEGVATGVPSSTPDITLASETIVTTTAGRIFGFGRGVYTENCVAVSLVRAGLYLDGVPLVGSGAPMSPATNTELHLFGITPASVAPGSHILTLRTDCTTSAPQSGLTGGDAALGAIVLSK